MTEDEWGLVHSPNESLIQNSTILIKHKMKEKNEEWEEKKGENNTLCNSHSQAIMEFENYSKATR